MARQSGWIAIAVLLGGCLTTGSGSFGDDDAPIIADADADSDTDVLPEEPVCPAYPTGETGFGIGQVVPDFAMPGGNGAVESQWTMNDIWCAANQEDNPPSVVLLDVHSLTCGICMQSAAPELEQLWEQDGDAGLLPIMAVINDASGGAGSVDTAEAECDRLGCTHPWAADIGFSQMSRFFTGGSVGTPAYIVIETATMKIRNIQQGWGGTRALYEGYLRAE